MILHFGIVLGVTVKKGGGGRIYVMLIQVAEDDQWSSRKVKSHVILWSARKKTPALGLFSHPSFYRDEQLQCRLLGTQMFGAPKVGFLPFKGPLLIT